MTDSASTRIHLTQAAAQKVHDLLQAEGDFDLKLRAYITGGGCSGFQYGFTFDPEQKEDDVSVTKSIENSDAAVTLVVDPISYGYLKEASIDYVRDGQGERFIIHNPNAKTTCGCGSSFAA